MRMKKIAVLTGTGGQGHFSVATALESWIKIWGHSAQVFDVIPKVNGDLYKILTKSPKSYRSLFNLTDRMPVANLYIEAATHDLKKRLGKLKCNLESFDLVISTHPFIHPVCHAKTMMVLLDPVLHMAYMAKPRADKYLAFWPNDLSKVQKMGVKKSDIFLSGPLARPAFYFNPKTNTENIILVTAGGGWIHKTDKYIKIMSETFKDTPYTFVFVCGKNTKFYEKKSKEFKNRRNLRFLSWLNEQEMANWVAKSRCVLAFSVAQMSVEAGLLGKPIFIADYIMGQEDGYIKALTNKKIAKLLCGKPAEKIDLLKTFLLEANPIKEISLTSWKNELNLVPEKIKGYII